MTPPDDKPEPMCKEPNPAPFVPTTAERYQAALLCVFQCAQFISTADVPDLLARIERAHSFGALLDPTLYRQKVQAMDQDKEMIEAALPLWRWAKRLEERVKAKAAAQKGGA